MIVQYSVPEILDLSHAVCKNFYPDQKDRFEIYKESKRVLSDDQAMMIFYKTKFEALTAFKVLDQPWYAAMIWDLAGGQWAVVCSMTLQQYRKITE